MNVRKKMKRKKNTAKEMKSRTRHSHTFSLHKYMRNGKVKPHLQ